MDINRLLAAGSVEGPFKKTRPVRRGVIGRMVRALLKAAKCGGKLL
ncbi:hypothetical protein [Azohydromonas lata]|nr:hypothetical protein [Azohydromonas lata]